MTNRVRAPVSRRHVIKAAGALVAAPAVLRVSAAFAAFPDRPVRIVVANSPGGPSDIVARILAASLQDATGNSFVVENKGGAGGNIGMGSVARAEADGYTLLLATNSVSVNVGLYNQLPYDIAKDFAAVCDVATSPNNFSVRSELPANSIKELVAMVKANPEKFNISSPPIGTTPQLQTALFKLRENLPGVANIIFTGGGEALQALLTGTSQISSGSLPPAAAHIKAGTLKALAVTGETRWPDLPDVPTMQEQGYKDFVFATDTALLAPAATPPDVMAKLETETRAVLARPEMKERLFKSGFQVRGTDGKTCMARIAKEVTMFSDIINQAGIKKL